RPVRPEVAERWAERVEDLDDFRYSAKLWRRFTHERDEVWSRAEVRAVRDGLRPLLRADKLDALLIQFPWSFKNEEGNREWLADLVDTFREFPPRRRGPPRELERARFLRVAGRGGRGVREHRPAAVLAVDQAQREGHRPGRVRPRARPEL